MSTSTPTIQAYVDGLEHFLVNAPAEFDASTTQCIQRFALPNDEFVSCVLWDGLYHITGTDIVRAMTFRFQAIGRVVHNMKKFEEGIFSDLRNLKAGHDATLEEPRSPFLQMLYKNHCIRTQKKQKVFYWFSVKHGQLFADALERDLKREALGHEPSTVAIYAMDPAASFLSPPLAAPGYEPAPLMLAPVSFSPEPASPSLSPRLAALTVNSDVASDADLDMWLRHLATEHRFHGARRPTAPAVLARPSDVPYHNSVPSQSESMPPPAKRRRSDEGYGSVDGLASSEQCKNLSDLSPRASSPVAHLEDDLATFSLDGAAFPITNGCIAPELIFANPPAIPVRSNSFTFGGNSNGAPFNAWQTSDSMFSMFSEFDPSASLSDSSEDLLATMSSELDVTMTSGPTSLVSSSPPSSVPSGSPAVKANNQRVFDCTFAGCGRKFKRFEHLKRHHRIHTKERPYVCQFAGCGKNFARSDNLANHVRVHRRASSFEVEPLPGQTVV